MGETLRLNTRDMAKLAPTLRAGQRVLLSGVCYTSRDAAHKRICQLLDEGKDLPYPLEGAAIYYAGPTPAPEGLPIGSCGPTTSGRMDPYTPRFLDLGLQVHDRQGQAQPGGHRGHEAQRGRVPVRHWGSGRPGRPVYPKGGGHRL